MTKFDFVVFSLGCKVNSYEGRAMISKLAQSGYSATEELEYADNYIINTCSVTSEADRKSRQAVSRILKINPSAKIYVCGCSSQNDKEQFIKKGSVRIVGGVGGKINLLDKILQDIIEPVLAPMSDITLLPRIYEDDLKPELTKTRGYIKVQDGCDNFCSYCIIPYLRGRSRSRKIESIVDEAEKAAKNTNEIVLTGINLSAFGKDTGFSLLDLVNALGKVPARKRLGSLECHIITPQFVQRMLENGFCDHFHLSMQSGSDTVLKRMNRHYTSKEFLEKIEIIRQICPDAGITTDIIAGFPLETEEEHAQTVQTVKAARFSDAHVFPYSERKGTNAVKLKQVDKKVRESRAAELTGIKNGLREEFLKAQSGKTAEVYFEESCEDTDFCGGYTSNYIKVYAPAPVGQILKVKLSQIYKDGLKGELL